MHVLATAGHVDHGKSTLIRALTGSDPDRLAEEKRRGLTIDLGFAWTEIEGAGEIAFVDVPGHQKFFSTTLAGLGPVPAVLFVVAADQGWRRQSGEHLAALDALGVEHALLVITRSDLAAPALAATIASEQLAATSLVGSPWVAVSAQTGSGLGALRTAIATLVNRLPPPEPPRRQRIWIDRAFTITGTGTVVTGTLGAGTISVGDGFELNGATVTVKALESLGRPAVSLTGTARVAIALRGVDRELVSRGDALLAPGMWSPTSIIDVRTTKPVEPQALPRELILHLGTAAVPVTQRELSANHLRLTLASPLPLAVGDRALLRDAGRQQVIGGVIVADIDPPALDRRGAAVRRAHELAARGDALDPAVEIGRRPFATIGALASIGLTIDPVSLPPGVAALDGRLLTTTALRRLSENLALAVEGTPTGINAETLRERLGVPTPAAFAELVAADPGLGITAGGRVVQGGSVVPGDLVEVAALLANRWTADPLDAPTADELRELGLDGRALGILQSLGLLVRLSDAVVVGPSAVATALEVLQTVEAPFTASEARSALGSSRRIVLPLLGYLDSQRLTARAADDRRRLR